MGKINRDSPYPRSANTKHADYKKVNNQSIEETGSNSSMQERVTSSVRAFFQRCSASLPAQESIPARRASFQAQLTNLIHHYPPSEKSIGSWHAFIDRIYHDPQIGEDGLVSALEAIVYLRAYKELEHSKMSGFFVKNLSYKIAEELVQALREGNTADLNALFFKIKQKNAPQEDEIDPFQFINAVKKMQVDVLNSIELKAYVEDIEEGKWPKGELRTIHLINYSPQQLSKIHRILSKLEKDQRFPELVDRLIKR